MADEPDIPLPPPQGSVREDIASLRRWCDAQDRQIHERMISLIELADAALAVTLASKLPENTRRQQATKALHMLHERLSNAAQMSDLVTKTRAQMNDVEARLNRFEQAVRDNERGV
jgi:hypothetical protein